MKGPWGGSFINKLSLKGSGNNGCADPLIKIHPAGGCGRRGIWIRSTTGSGSGLYSCTTFVLIPPDVNGGGGVCDMDGWVAITIFGGLLGETFTNGGVGEDFTNGGVGYDG